MSITFSIARKLDDGSFRLAYRCDCSQRWCDACDQANAEGKDSPEMFTCENCTDKDINMANVNAVEWMRWVGLDADYGGEIKATELAALCRRRLWNENRNHDPGVPGQEYKVDGGPRVIMGERRPGYLRERTEQMLKLCELACERFIVWG